MTAASLRKKLGLSRRDWARSLNVNERTVMRWENSGDSPGGVAAAVLLGIEDALKAGAEPAQTGRIIVGHGIARLISSILKPIKETP